ncbi:hypothetical protein BU23DRAFT_153659 [Bimuria novae-zelandiae CBS 107.79]|uniref:Uncharacterized protein n=1 Tax=Bimuria novae-zelandiae CBS 107.79 TaxID=1447943 RepID=A0A6A5VNT0_9PLEO|nr:hypothetical protein BU23DRAFT_153659 [Bimuria novae-zelandiae CBS 107.79]
MVAKVSELLCRWLCLARRAYLHLLISCPIRLLCCFASHRSRVRKTCLSGTRSYCNAFVNVVGTHSRCAFPWYWLIRFVDSLFSQPTDFETDKYSLTISNVFTFCCLLAKGGRSDLV